MKSFARIRAGAGAILLPARNPYDYELVLEHLEHALHLQNELDLDLCGRPFLVRAPSDTEALRCDGCQKSLDRLLLATPQQTLCFACALREPLVSFRATRSASA